MRVGNCFYGTRGGYDYVQGMHAYGFGMFFLFGIGMTLIVALLFFILLHNKKKKGIDISLLSEEKINCTTDRYRLGQSIYNILTNAYKFTPIGGKVTISYVIEDKIISIKIKDTGCGIPQNELNQIFEPYQKGNGNKSLQGDGLGLFIARENLEKMNGTIGVTSKVGEGSEFEIRI